MEASGRDVRDSIAALLRQLRERKSAEVERRARALLASCAAHEQPLVEAFLAVVEWRARAAQGAPLGDGLREAIAGTTQLAQAELGASLGWISGNLGYALGLLGDLESGLAWLDGAINDALRRDDRLQLVYAYSHKATLLAFAEEHDRAVALFQQALALCEGPAAGIRAGLLNNVAYAHILRARRCGSGDPMRADLAREALRCADEALGAEDSPEYWRWHGNALENRGIALRMLGRLDEAEACFVAGLGLPKVNPQLRADLSAGHAEVLIDRGRLGEARELLEQAAAILPEKRISETADRIFGLQIEIARREGRADDTHALWERRFRHVSERYRERLANVHRYAELHEELRRAQATARESRQRERESLLRDLHDGFGSQLASARLAAQRGALTQDELVGLLDECIADLYLVVDTMTNVGGSLGDALRFLRNRLQQRLAGQPIRLHWEIALDNAPSLGHPRLVQALRIVQEAVANALKHARAANVRVDARLREADTFVISVRDDGVGLPPSLTEGHGLSGMRSRAMGLGGRLTVAREGNTTCVELAFAATPAQSPPADPPA